MAKKLYEPGDGVLQTHISWEEIETDAQNALGTKATFGPNKTVKNLSLGRGFTSRMALIQPDWQNGEENLPKALIAKIPSCMNVLDFQAMMKAKGRSEFDFDKNMLTAFQDICKKVHNVECDVYDIIQKHGHGKIKIPFIMALKKFDEQNSDKGNLMMEHIDCEEVQVYDNLTFDEIKEPLRMIAVFQVIGTKLDEDTKKTIPRDVYSELFQEMFFKEEKRMQFVEMFRKFDGGAIPKETLDKFCRLIHKVMCEENVQKMDKLSDILGMNRVLCHGDLWSTNLLWKKKANKQEKHELAAVIDWQVAHYGSPAVDICRFLMASLSGKERREKLDKILETLHEYLVEECEGAEPPYTLSQLKESVKHFYPMAGIFVAISIQSLFESNNNSERPDREEVVERIREKTLAMLEDVIGYYEETHPGEDY